MKQNEVKWSKTVLEMKQNEVKLEISNGQDAPVILKNCLPLILSIDVMLPYTTFIAASIFGLSGVSMT